MRALLSMCFLVLSSCGSSTTGSETTTDAATSPPKVPEVHRASVAACPTDRPPGSASAPPGATNKCTSDADCTAGKNGRCYGSPITPNVCSYDECFTDGDCSAAVCDCRNGGVIGQPNRCILGNCRTDADCKGNYCSPSGTTLAAGCMGPSAGGIGFFCHTAADECINDSECGDPIVRCLFEPEVLHWKCIKVLCPR